MLAGLKELSNGHPPRLLPVQSVVETVVETLLQPYNVW